MILLIIKFNDLKNYELFKQLSIHSFINFFLDDKSTLNFLDKSFLIILTFNFSRLPSINYYYYFYYYYIKINKNIYKLIKKYIYILIKNI